MAFNGNSMNPTGGNSRTGSNILKNAPMSWAYQSGTDTKLDVLATGYFDTFNKFLEAGHFIYAHLADENIIINIKSVDKVLGQVVVDPRIFQPNADGVNLFVVAVLSLSDFPTPIANVINGADTTVYWVQADVDIGANQFKFGTDTRILGFSSTVTKLRGTTTGPLIITNGIGGVKIQDMGIVQMGSGGIATIASPNSTSTIINTAFEGGDIRLVSGLIGYFDLVGFLPGSRLIQDASGFFTTIEIVNLSALFGSSTFPTGALVFETGSVTDNLLLTDLSIALLETNITAIRVEQGAIIRSMFMGTTNLRPFFSGTLIMEVENPDDIQLGTVENTNILGAGSFLRCNPISSSAFSSVIASVYGIAQDGLGNIILSGAAQISKLTGISGAVDTSIAAPAFAAQGIAWHTGDLYSLDADTNLMYHHFGFSTSITTSISQPTPDTTDMVFAGEDLVTIDSTTHIVSVHNGFSAILLSTFAAPSTTGPLSIAYDGVNLLIGDGTGKIFVMQGISATVQYSFDSAAGVALKGLSLIYDPTAESIGLVASDSVTTGYHVYNHPVTFDHSSKTWAIANSTGVVTSADRGGSEFVATSATPPAVDLETLNVWEDIEATGIAYNLFKENEKVILFNELTGEVMFVGVRNDACNLNGQVTITRAGGAGDRIYQIAVELNGVIVKDTISQGVLPVASSFVTITTLPISRNLAPNDKIKLKIRQTSGGVQDPDVLFSKLSVT